jgi:hypothetical protein
MSDAALMLEPDNLATKAWPCRNVGCEAVRVFEGGRPLGLSYREYCDRCGGRFAVTPEDRAIATKMIAATNHLI